MRSIDGPLLSWLIVLGVGGLLLAAAGVIMVRLAQARREVEARLQAQTQELESLRQALDRQTQVLLETEREVSRLKRIPKAELLPMMQLAHELRSPLASVGQSLEMILQGYARNNPQLHDQMLTLAQSRATTMLERINDFLRLGMVQYAEIERRPQRVQLLDILERMMPEMQVRAKWVAVDLHFDVPASLPPVVVAIEDMEHLLSNLITNAVKYTEPGGTVVVSLRQEGEWVVGRVEDTGIGIAATDIPHIFDEFYRAEQAKDKASGTGLGLSIVKRILDLCGGQIEVESELGKGSRFTFSLPLEAQAKEASL